MKPASALTIHVALLSAPDDTFQPLKGMTVRQCELMNTHPEQQHVQATPWQTLHAVSERRYQLDIEGLVTDDIATLRLRKAALQALTLRCRIGWPGMGSSEADFVIKEYREFADADDALRFQAVIASKGEATLSLS